MYRHLIPAPYPFSFLHTVPISEFVRVDLLANRRKTIFVMGKSIVYILGLSVFIFIDARAQTGEGKDSAVAGRAKDSLNMKEKGGASGDEKGARDSAKLLQQAVVTGKKTFMEQRNDRLIIHVDAAVTNVGATALEVLQKCPGVSIDKDGNISMKGRQGVLVMIDGKPTYLSGADLANLLTSMNANQLEQVEIMTNPSAKYDAAGNAGIIDIKTRKSTAKGFSGNINIGYGQGKYAKTNNSLNLNYRNGKYNLFGSYSYNGARGYTDLHLTRRYLDPDGKTVNSIFDEPTYIDRHFASHNIKLGMDYFLRPNTTVGMVVTGFDSPRDFNGISDGFLQDASGHTDSITHTVSADRNRVLNGTLNLNLRQRFDSAHELTADADYIIYQATSTQLFTNTSSYPDGTVTGTNELKGNLPSTIRIYSGKADYSQSLGTGSKLEAGVKSSLVQTENASDYFDLAGAVWQPDYGKTNDFNYRENINAGYLNLNRETGKWSLQAGLRFEHTNYSGHESGNPQKKDSSFSHEYNSWFPTTEISYQANKNNQFTLSAGRRIDRPAYQDLNPFLFFINQYTYQEGNPFLAPQYTSNLELSHIFKGVLTTTLNYSNTQAYITQIFQSHSDTTIFGQGNLGKLETAGISVNAQLNPSSWWGLTLHTDIDYKRVNGYTGGEPVRTEGVLLQFNVNNQFHWKKGWSGELSGLYASRDVEGQFVSDPYGEVSAGVAHQVMNNKATVKLNVKDIWHTLITTATITYENVREHFIQSNDTRVVNLSFTYRFGKTPKDPGSRHLGGADEEQNRVKL